MGRIGISSPNWRQDAGGKYYLSTGAEFSVNDLGRLGTTVAKLSAGSDSVGLSSEIFRDLTAPRAANPMFSAGIWWNRNASRPGAISAQPERNIDAPRPPTFWQNASLAAGIDPGWLALVGSGGKRVYVLPEQGLVIARVSRAGGWDDGAFLRAVTASSRA
jgi:CubicO group peptidase (beta-lactamase class C family)